MAKDQVWKIIFFFHSNRPKKIFFRLFQIGKWQKNFPYIKTAYEPCKLFLHNMQRYHTRRLKLNLQTFRSPNDSIKTAGEKNYISSDSLACVSNLPSSQKYNTTSAFFPERQRLKR